MMLFARKSVGVEISQHGVLCVLLTGSVAAPQIERVSSAPLAAGVLRTSLREQNILDPEAFSQALRNAHNLLLYPGTRLSVSLPDAVGRIMLQDVGGRFKNRSEALDVIRWKLKKSLPFDLADTHLDYQQLCVRENGDNALLIALVSRGVICQYEDAISAAGFTPSRIDFNIFNICRTFEHRLDLQDDGMLLYFHGSTLGLMAFHSGVPEFVRIKELTGVRALDSRVFMEINSSLLVYRERFHDRILSSLFCVAPPEVSDDFCSMVSEAVGIDPVALEVKSVVTPGDSSPADQVSLFPFTAAIGAALRSM